MIALGEEYTKRYGKQHLTITKCKDLLARYPGGILLRLASINLRNAMPDEYKRDCAIHAYWLYYVHEKKNIAHNKEKLYDTKYIKDACWLQRRYTTRYPEQTDSTPFITAQGHILMECCPGAHRWIAVSRDLRSYKVLYLAQKSEVTGAGDLDGIWTVKTE